MTYSFVTTFQRREEGTPEECAIYHQKKVQLTPPPTHTHTLVARVMYKA